MITYRPVVSGKVNIVQNGLTNLLGKLSLANLDIWKRQLGERELTTSELCQRLLSLKGEASSVLVAEEIIHRLESMDKPALLDFCYMLLNDMQADPEKLMHAAQSYIDHQGSAEIVGLQKAIRTKRQSFFEMISVSSKGPSALVKFRENLLEVLRDHPGLKAVDDELVRLFRSWFNRGFLELRKIDWSTPALVLEKLIDYEAVHEIKGWDDLRRRLAEDRRCYAFFHPALKDEPLIFVQVALTNEIVTKISDVIEQEVLSIAHEPSTAIFYSISNCQPGLSGVSFGNFLIKQVVQELSSEVSSLENFATLSPIPGFQKWLSTAMSNKQAWLEEGFATDGIHFSEEAPVDLNSDTTSETLRNLCAHYLLNEKRDMMPLDPVARFHLGNGARLENINKQGDLSRKGERQSYRLMVNYVYDLPKLEKYHEGLVNEGTVAASVAVQKWAASAKPSTRIKIVKS